MPIDDKTSLSSSKIKELSDEFVKLAEEKGFLVTECHVRCAERGITNSGLLPISYPEDGKISLTLHRGVTQA